MASIISSGELLRRLIQERDHIAGEDPEACSTDVGPSPETIVTGGLYLDPA
jgi:hypothetical protein